MKTFACRVCTADFECATARGQDPYWCDDCRPTAERARNRVAQAVWREKNREKTRAYAREAYAKNPDAARNSQLKVKFGISLEEYKAILASQGGACAFCRTKECPTGKQFHVDHDHACCPGLKSCGKCLRGLLCHHCNAQLVAGYEKLPHEARTWEAMNTYLAGQIERDPWLIASSEGSN